MGKLKIAIDGPSGVGKSTVSDSVAKALGIHHLNTGALYRTFGYGCKKNGVDILNQEEVENAINTVKVVIKFDENSNQLNYCNGELVNDFIFNNEIALVASKVSTYKKVREHIVELQREISQEFDIILEGRDICEVVLPDATFKFFLTASSEARAERVTKMYHEKGQKISYEETLKGLNDRDYQDTHREISPLRQAEDAIVIDSTNSTQEEVVAKILQIVKGE